LWQNEIGGADLGWYLKWFIVGQISTSMINASFNVPSAHGTAVRTAVLDLELLTL